MVWCCDPLEPILSDFETIQVDEFDKQSVVATVPSSELIVSGKFRGFSVHVCNWRLMR
jgi:hypothetical protein